MFDDENRAYNSMYLRRSRQEGVIRVCHDYWGFSTANDRIKYYSIIFIISKHMKQIIKYNSYIKPSRLGPIPTAARHGKTYT